MEVEVPTFQVTRKAPELIPPARATPNELKFLSPLDELEGLRLLVPVVQFYKKSELALVHGKDPVDVIRKAIAEALIYYYPLAGRLKETRSDGKKMVVDCTGEGVMFIEADADVGIEEFGDVIYPPISGLSELLFDVPGSGGMLCCPLLLVQVTRLTCGGFVMATRFNHTICDGFGFVQFLTAVSEFARGFSAPSVHPIWQRSLISARDPPRISYVHREFDQVPLSTTALLEKDKMIQKPFIFKNKTVSLLCQQISPADNKCSSFDLIAAIIWRARTISLILNPTEEVRLLCVVESRNKFSPPIPTGYYGNVMALPAAVTTAGQLQANSIHYAMELIKDAKARVNEDYMRSMIDLAVVKDRPPFAKGTTFILSDIRRAGTHEVDYGWGKAEFGGAVVWGGDTPSMGSFFIPVKAESFVVALCLPELVMDLFAKELHHMISNLQVRANL